jgi:hypothetical protein
MKEWLGVVGYCLKDTIANALSGGPNLELAQERLGHLSKASTKRYTRATSL